MVPIRYAFRNRWWTLAWAIGIFASAISFAGQHGTKADAAANGAADSDNLGAISAAIR